MQYIGAFILGVVITVLVELAAIPIAVVIGAGKAEKEKDKGAERV